jgi:hypothetical protein
MSYLEPRLREADRLVATDQKYQELAAKINELEADLRRERDCLESGAARARTYFRIDRYERELIQLRTEKLSHFLELTFHDLEEPAPVPEVLPSSYSRMRPLEPAIVEDQSNPFTFPNQPIYPVTLKNT